MSTIDPSSARTAEDFVMLLRQARALSEQTFWQLEQAANAAGYELEPAVLAETLGLAALPDRTLVTAMLTACGYPPDEIEHWLSIRDRLAPLPGLAPAAAEPVWVPLVAPGSTSAAEARAGGPDDATARFPQIPAPAAARPRHTLRIPGRGSRRAPCSRLRPLLMAAAAAVVLAGGIAVIVAAISHGEANSGVPVYAPGSPRTGAAPQPSASAQADTIAALSPAPSPSRTGAPVSAAPALAGVLRSGTTTLKNGQSIDLDGGGSDPDVVVFGDGDGVRAGPSDRHFALEPTATRQACATLNGYQKSLQNLAAGSGICVRTDKGRYAHLTVTRTGPLAFSYVVWS